MLKRLRQANLKLQPTKCSFFRRSVVSWARNFGGWHRSAGREGKDGPELASSEKSDGTPRVHQSLFVLSAVHLRIFGGCLSDVQIDEKRRAVSLDLQAGDGFPEA